MTNMYNIDRMKGLAADELLAVTGGAGPTCVGLLVKVFDFRICVGIMET
ncbi:MAG TPA: hypothetical protein VKE22_17565 [Haliangiales bacterium]|nr:hypothetical protein [Haliangiales bacterium]